MTGRLQLIEQKLTGIAPAGFQNLCDAYLILREDEYGSFNRTGSQLGKQKTIPGTPDSFIRLDDNKLAYIEYTTQAESKVSKIKEDIDKCLDESKTGISQEKLFQIIVCFNSRLTVEEEVEIQEYAESKNKRIELIGIDTLALEILSKYVLLSRDFLGIPIDTGQILPLDKFISEYNNKANQLSTPLNNEFLHRKVELTEILGFLQTGDLLLLSGAPGVGKTKIGIKAISEFIKQNTDYISYAISKKNVDIYEDLRIQLHVDKNYILLIDDANRQLSNLNQILGIFRERRKGNIKIIITVRNYALNDIYKLTNDLDKHIVEIRKFTDEEIIHIIASDSFKILHNKYQKKIVEISDGNARLAVMAARLANEKQTEFLWGDVSDLFDSYFDKFISDYDLFKNNTILKVLGIISFFFTINRNDKAFIESITNLFGIDYYDFNEALEELHKRELIEVQYNHARVSEQVMATYFFYKVFIKENILSFRVLLDNFYTEWKSRFMDSIIPANNSFGYKNVITKIENDLSEYLHSISDNEDEVLNFLDLFWFYKLEDTISYFYEKVLNISEPDSPIYLTHYETNDFVYSKEQIIDFISRFFNHLTEWFKPSIELGFEYIRKKPEHLPEFIRRIRENLMFDEPDERLNFKRQVDFIDILIENSKNNKPHYISAFFALVKSFLAHTFNVTHGGRKHTITWYNYPLPFNEVIKELRKKIWETLFDNYEKYPNEVFEVLIEFKPTHHDLVPEIMDFDLSLLVPFISEKLSPNIFKHAYFVQEMIYWNNREEKITNRSYQDLKQKFLTDEYSMFCKLDWNKLRDKNDFEFDNWQEYDNLKSEEIRRNFVFKDESEFDKLLRTISNIQSIKKDNYFSASQSLDIVIEENFIQNPEIGFKLLKTIFNNYPSGLHLLYRSVRTIINKSEDWCLTLWNELEKWVNDNSLFWRINFYNYLPDNFINTFFCKKLGETIDSIDKYAYLYLEVYYRFNIVDKHITNSILRKAADKIDKLNIVIVFSDDVFEKNLDFFENDYELIKRSYFQQYNINHSQIFDFKGKGFARIFERYPEFLKDFISKYYTDHFLSNRNTGLKLSFLWDNDLNFKIIEETLDLVVERNPYIGIGDHSINIFFNELNENQLINAKEFIKQYLTKNKNDDLKINLIFDGIRHCLNNLFEEFFLYFLSINTDSETFQRIDWVGNVGVQVGEVNFSDLYAKKWEYILEIVNKSNDTLPMIPIKAYLKKKIEGQYKSAEHEREMKFLRPDW